MPTSYTDQFFTFDPANPPAAGTSVDFQRFTLVDQNDDGDIDEFDDDSVTGQDVTATWPGDTVTIDVPGQGEITYTGTTVYISDGTRIFTPTDGQVLQPGTFVSSTFVTSQGPLFTDQLGPSCFLPGTQILTPGGARSVEDLRPGDMVTTADHGSLPLLHLRSRTFEVEELKQNPRLGPVLIPQGAATGARGGPALVVSPQHRLLIGSAVVSRMFGVAEVLAPAAQLIGFGGITRAKVDGPVTYHHILLPRHAIVTANQIPCESLFLGAHARADLSRLEMLSLLSVWPERKLGDMPPARPFVSGKPLKRLLHRHAKNDKPLVATVAAEGRAA